VAINSADDLAILHDVVIRPISEGGRAQQSHWGCERPKVPGILPYGLARSSRLEMIAQKREGLEWSKTKAVLTMGFFLGMPDRKPAPRAATSSVLSQSADPQRAHKNSPVLPKVWASAPARFTEASRTRLPGRRMLSRVSGAKLSARHESGVSQSKNGTLGPCSRYPSCFAIHAFLRARDSRADCDVACAQLLVSDGI
jgi:hypothetical protein